MTLRTYAEHATGYPASLATKEFNRVSLLLEFIRHEAFSRAPLNLRKSVRGFKVDFTGCGSELYSMKYRIYDRPVLFAFRSLFLVSSLYNFSPK